MKFTLKDPIKGITQTFTVHKNFVAITDNLKVSYIPSYGEMNIDEARKYWKELTQNGWTRI